MLNEKFKEVMSHEGVVSIVTWANDDVNVSNTWNSYVRFTEDGRLLIPAAGMKKTEDNININNKVKLTVGTKEVKGLWGPGAGFLIEAEASFVYEGAEFEATKAAFPFMNRVLSIKPIKITQTV